ncbi:MAG: hypothetical protein HQL30_08825 [Candidatus Omnitrophica bacterium]|nr:hypothetical protein [Candidatus Omnitrophota bacterium]
MLRKEVYDELKKEGDMALRSDMDVVQLTSPFARKKYRASLGNKGAMLGDVMDKAGSVKELAGLNIPEGFILTTNMYRKWFNSDRKISSSEDMKKQIKFNLAFIYLQTEANRAGEGKSNVELTVEAAKIAGTMEDDFGGWDHFKVSVRSSPAASAPGKFDTVAGKQTLPDIFAAIDTVFNSWHDRVEGDKNKAIGMGIVVQRMVIGDAQAVDGANNMIPREVEVDGETRPDPSYIPDSFTGVFFTQNIDTGRSDQISGNVKIEADGKKVVAGIDGGVPIQWFREIDRAKWKEDLVKTPNGREIANFLEKNKAVYEELHKYGKALEKEYGYPQDIEFTVENGALYILQVREAKTTPRNTIKFLKNMVERKDVKAMTEREAYKRAIPVLKMLNQKNVKAEDKIPANLAASFSEAFSVGGAASGKLVFCDNKGDGDEKAWAEVKRKIETYGTKEVILVARVADIPDHIYDMVGGILTLYGGGSSHAAVNTRMRNLPSIIGMFNGQADMELGKTLDIGGTLFREGAEMTFDSEGGKVYKKVVSLEDNGIKKDTSEFADLGAIFAEVERLENKAPDAGSGAGSDTVQAVGEWSRMEDKAVPIWKCRGSNGRSMYIVAKGIMGDENELGNIEELLKKRGSGFIKVVLFEDGLVLNLGGDIMHDEISEMISGSSGTPYVAGVATSRNGKFNGVVMQEMRNSYDNEKTGHGVTEGILGTLNSKEFNLGHLFEDARLSCAGKNIGGEKPGKIVRGEDRRLILEEAVTQKAIVKNFTDAELEAWRVERTGSAGSSLIDVKLAIEAIGDENERASAHRAMEKFMENGSIIRDYLVSEGLLPEDPARGTADLSPVKSELDKIPDLLKKPMGAGGFGIGRSKVVNKGKYALGDPDMLAIDIVNYLNAVDKRNGADSTLLAEYILHEAFERSGLGHYEIILLTSVIFGRTVSVLGELYSPEELAVKLKDRAWASAALSRMNKENGGVETDLGRALRSFINASAYLQESPDLDKMTIDELERLEKDLAFENDASTKLRVISAKVNAARARAALGHVAPGKHLDIVLVPINKDQLFFDGTSYIKINSDAVRTIQKDYGVNVRAIYYAIGDKESFDEAAEKAAKMMGDDGKARLLVYQNVKEEEKGGEFKKLELSLEVKNVIGERLTGVVAGTFEPGVETQRFSITMLVTLGLGLNEANREPDKAGTLKDAIIPLMKRMASNEAEIDRFMEEANGDLNKFLEKVYRGDIKLDIKKINYEEIRDFMESEADVLQSL